MTGWIGALFLIAVGAALLVVAWRGWNSGELPAGSKGLRSYRPNRETSPTAFHFFLLLYLAGGIALTVWGLLILIGAAAPLNLR